MKLHGYQTEPGIICVVTSMANVLTYIGTPINDSTLFLLGDGFVLDYSIEQVASIKDIKLHHYAYETIRRFFETYHISVSVKPFCENMEQFKLRAEEYIQQGLPIIIAVSTKGLDYHKVFPEMTDERRHIIVVIGVEDEVLHISDCYIPTLPQVSYYQGPVRIRSIEPSLRAVNWEIYDIDYRAVRDAKFDLSLNALLDALQRNIDIHLVDNVEKLSQFANDIPTLLERFGEEEIRANIKELYFYIKSNGIVPARQLLRKFLVGLDNEHHISSLTTHITALDELIKSWETFSIYFIKSGLSNKLSNKPFLIARNKLLALIEREQELFRELRQTIRNL